MVSRRLTLNEVSDWHCVGFQGRCNHGVIFKKYSVFPKGILSRFLYSFSFPSDDEAATFIMDFVYSFQLLFLFT